MSEHDDHIDLRAADRPARAHAVDDDHADEAREADEDDAADADGVGPIIDSVRPGPGHGGHVAARIRARVLSELTGAG